MKHTRLLVWLAALVVCLPTSIALAQGVTTGSMTGLVTDAQMAPVADASVIAIHIPSGTSYEATTRADGRFFIPAMRVGGPYSVTIAYTGGGGTAFEPQTLEGLTVNLGVATDVSISVRAIAVQEQVTVTATAVDAVFSSTRTGAATAVTRTEIATLPTVGGRIGDITRLMPQARGNSFAGADNRLNNITVDGAYFNNSFGLRAQPGETSGVAPISLEAIEQVQVSIAPFDVRQGNFVGAAVNTVTRSGTNRLVGSFYHRFRNDGFVGKEAKDAAFDPGTFTFRNTGGWAGGPLVQNRLFAFGTFEDEIDRRPLSTFRANKGGEPVGGGITRVLESDLVELSNFLRTNFNYDTGPVTDLNSNKETPARRLLLRTDYNLNNANKISFRYNYLDSSTDQPLSTSSSLGFGRSTSTSFLSYRGSSYSILENIRSGLGEWNAVFGSNMANSLIIGYTTQDESRGAIGTLFPFVDILSGGTAYTSFGSEPFTPNNELRYKTLQAQNSFTRFGTRHTWTFGGTLQRYESENVFFPGRQSAYVYNSLQDFYTDALDYLANPNRTTSPVVLNRFQVRYSNIPGQEKPIQMLKVWYGGLYGQDEWRPRQNLTLTLGLRFDVPVFGDTGYRNAKADALFFRDEHGNQVQYQTGKLPDANILWSPRFGFNWDIGADQQMQLRGGTGIFTGPPLYVWISNQVGNTGVLTGFDRLDNTTLRPFNPDPDRYKPTDVTGEPAPSYELALTENDFKFPQVWRNNIAFDRRLPWGLVGTVEFLYNRDINGIYYINANLPAAQSQTAGPDSRPRWTSNRINNEPGNQVANAVVMKNQNVGRSWNISTSLSKSSSNYSIRGAYAYGEAKNTVDPGSIAFGTWANNPYVNDPNNPGVGFSVESPGHRVFIQGSYSREYFGFGATTISAFWEARTLGNGSYVFAGDPLGAGTTNATLIYVPRDTSEMNFVPFTSGGRTFTAEEQAQAFEAYIQQDKYLRTRRGQYAERGGVLMPMVRRMDLSITQDVFRNIGGRRNAGQIRLDIQNVGNLLNKNWGVGQRFVVPLSSANGAQILTNPTVDANGRLAYRMAVSNNELVTRTFEQTAGIADVYQILLSFRYSFN